DEALSYARRTGQMLTLNHKFDVKIVIPSTTYLSPDVWYRFSNYYYSLHYSVGIENVEPYKNKPHMQPNGNYDSQCWCITPVMDNTSTGYYYLSTVFRGKNMVLDRYGTNEVRLQPVVQTLLSQHWKIVPSDDNKLHSVDGSDIPMIGQNWKLEYYQASTNYVPD
ncbi:unnamed protein product, partial [Didymodactylos carnosus]